MEDWSLVYQVRWFVWIPMSIAEEIVELFMAVLGLGGLVTGAAYLSGRVSLPKSEPMPVWLSLIALLFSAWLAWQGLRGSWRVILALFTPGLVYEGPLDSVLTRHVSGSHGGYRSWVLTAGDQSWETGRAFHESLAVKIQDVPVRIQYRRGTNEITHIWARHGRWKSPASNKDS